jgi:hypothetical protein
MIGRAGLMYTIGFGVVLSTIGGNLNRYAVEATGTMGAYYDATASHNLALAGANVGLAKFYQDTTWMGSISQSLNDSSMHGSFTAAMNDLGATGVMLRSVSSFSTWYAGTLHDTIEVYFNRNRRNSFTLFAWMTDNEGNVFWVTGDTVWGRVHSNGNLHVNGKPVFMEKATTSKQFDPKPGTGTNHAIYKQGYETGIAQIDLPSDMSDLINAANAGGKHYAGNIWITLSPGTAASGDGKAYIRSTQAGPIIDSIRLADPSFDGVILGDGRVNVSGTVDGSLSIASMTDVYIQDNILYEKDPLVGASDDVLGLVANQNVVVADNTANNSNCQIDAAVFARTGSFMAENYNSRGIDGTLNLIGSIVQETRGAVGQFNGSNLTSGFSKRYRYDPRFEDPTFRPPYYPGYYVRTYNITNWWESYRLPSIAANQM